MSIELKVKSKSLAAEAVIIRKEERKALKQARWQRSVQKPSGKAHGQFESLQEHRVGIVRTEARATHLARAYLAGVPYKTVEQSRKPEREWEFKNRILPRISAMAMKYKGKSDIDPSKKAIEDWINAE